MTGTAESWHPSDSGLLAQELGGKIESLLAELVHSTPGPRPTRIARLPPDLGGLGLRGTEQMLEASFVVCSETTHATVMRTMASLGKFFDKAAKAPEPDDGTLQRARCQSAVRGITMLPGR